MACPCAARRAKGARAGGSHKGCPYTAQGRAMRYISPRRRGLVSLLSLTRRFALLPLKA